MAKTISSMNVRVGGNVAGLAGAFASGARDVQGFSAKVGTASASVRGFHGHMNGLASRLPSITGLLGGMGLAFGVSSMLNGFADAEVASAKLDAVLRSTGGAAGLTAGEIKTLARDLQQVTKFEDDATIAGAAVLATFTSIKGDQFKGAIVAAQNLSAAMGQDLQSSIVQIGKALNNPIKGVTALSRVGVSFTDSQKKMISSLQESGNMMAAQELILNELKVEFGGAAEAVGRTFSGRIEQAKNAVGDLAETLGAAAAPALGNLADGLKSAAGWAKTHSDAISFGAKTAASAVVLIVGYKVALFAVATAQRAVATATAITTALSGPTGWAKLAAGAVAAAAAIYGVNQMFDGMASSAAAAADEADEATARLTNRFASLHSSGKKAIEELENAGKSAGKTIDTITQQLAKLNEDVLDAAASASGTDPFIAKLDRQAKELAKRRADAEKAAADAEAIMQGSITTEAKTGGRSEMKAEDAAIFENSMDAMKALSAAQSEVAKIDVAFAEIERTKQQHAQLKLLQEQTKEREKQQAAAEAAAKKETTMAGDAINWLKEKGSDALGWASKMADSAQFEMKADPSTLERERPRLASAIMAGSAQAQALRFSGPMPAQIKGAKEDGPPVLGKQLAVAKTQASTLIDIHRAITGQVVHEVNF